jgi:recombination protein RecA
MHPESRKSLSKLLENKYDIQNRLGTVAGKEIMYINQQNSEKILQLIKYYIHPSMSYKLLPQFKHKFSITPQFSEPSRKLIKVPILKIVDKPKTRSMVRFDIGVKRYHNFLADNILVHNSPETTPGGKALKFYTSVRLDIRRIAQIKKGDEVMGGRVRVKVVKNKVAAPFKQTEFDLMYNEGISREGELIALGEKLGLMKKSGTSYEYDGVKLGRGYDATRQFLRENKKVAGEILRAILKQLKDGTPLETKHDTNDANDGNE